MKVSDLQQMLEGLVQELKALVPNLPAGIKFEAPHNCCNCGDGYCYASGEDVELYSLNLSFDNRYDKKTKVQKTEKVYLTGN